MNDVLDDPRLAALPRELCKDLARHVLRDLRASEMPLPQRPDVAGQVQAWAMALLAGRQRAVINATGVVLHTNLGRAPWPRAARDAAIDAMGYGNVELDLETGRRGGRMSGVRALMHHLIGCEDALVVNNGAAAVLLALTALGRDKDVLVSRGELVEIGGSFRVPDVIASGGARLVDVGTTNRTRISDYRQAIGPDAAVLLRVHRSNFRLQGFWEEPSLSELVQLSRDTGLPLVHDLGSGALSPLGDEPLVRDSVAAGVDVVIFSGDKLLGGPQAGLIVGREAVVQRLARHPLYRALRVDKVTLAALEATLASHLRGDVTPVDAMLGATLDDLQGRAEVLAAALRAAGLDAEVAEDVSQAGGGSLPGEGLESRVVALSCPDPDGLARDLRLAPRSVVARIHRGRLMLDVRTLSDDEVAALPDLITQAWTRRAASP